jgi:hypothetical protein
VDSEVIFNSLSISIDLEPLSIVADADEGDAGEGSDGEGSDGDDGDGDEEDGDEEEGGVASIKAAVTQVKSPLSSSIKSAVASLTLFTHGTIKRIREGCHERIQTISGD